MEKYSVGLDIGIASCGWSIVDVDKKEIVDLGSHIFPSGTAANNQECRSFRGLRRLKRRRGNRLQELNDFIGKEFFPETKYSDKNGYEHYRVLFSKNENNPYELRVKGLTKELTLKELSSALNLLVKRRGISYDLGDLEDDGTSGVSDYKSSININRKLLAEGQTVGQIQLNRLKEQNQVRGQIKVNDDTTWLNVFPSSAYADEARQILTKQQAFHPEITEEFIEQIVDLIQRKREYFIGPGNEKSRTDYGIYKTDGRTLDNLFDELIGEDEIGTKIAGVKQKRASASSLAAQIYNLFNDLNNLTIPNTEDGKLTKETKIEILTAAKTTDGQFGISQICKLIGAKKEDIKGFRIDKSEKPIIHTLSGYRKFRKALAEIGIEANAYSTEFFDKVADILTLNTEKAEVRKQLNKSELEIPDTVKELIIDKNKELLVDGRATWHSFSYTTLNLLIPELLNTSEEQMTILTRLGLMKLDNEKYRGLKNIPASKIADEIYNPMVAKSTREAINVFNAIAKRLGRENIEHVVIELPREDNEDDVKKNKIKFQKAQATEKEKSDETILQQLSISNNELLAKYRRFKGLSQKVRYWYQQEGACPYCGKKIKAIDLINQNESFEVDHIIPISISFDDSQNNKVLVHSQCNQEKGQQTPLGWINNGGGFGQSKTDYIAKVKANKNYAKNKRENLLNEADLNDIETRRSFIQRNINDTRYASRVVLNELYSFFKSNDLPTRVKVVRGKWTSQMRKKWNSVGGLEKTRETHHHHAIDASIIASFPLLKSFDKAVKLIDIDRETGEILKDKAAIRKARESELLAQWAIPNEKEFEKLDSEIFDYPIFKQVELANDIDNPDNPVKFSHKVDKKANRAVANQTIYGTRERKTKKLQGRGKNKQEVDISEKYIFGTIKNIYGVDDYAKFKKLYDEATKKGENKFLMQEKDPQTWQKLEKILKDYPDFYEEADGKKKAISPFELYRQDNSFVTKYAKHNNGPKVVSLKYYDSKVGNHIDITPQNAKNKVVLQSLKPWRTDVYYNPETRLYELLGLKYADLKYTNGVYGISDKKYEELKHGIEPDGTITWTPISQNSEFRFSLYRGNRIKVIDDKGEEIEVLFSSIFPDGRCEVKPIHKAKYGAGETVKFYGSVTPNGQFVKKLCREGYKLYKVNTDILGTPYYTEKESNQPKLKIKI